MIRTYKDFLKLNIFQKATAFLFLYPAFQPRLQVLLIGLWALISLVGIIKEKRYKYLSKGKVKLLLFLISPYILYLIEFIFSKDSKIMLSYLETGVFILIFPLFSMFYIDSFSNKLLSFIKLTYVISISLLNVYILFYLYSIGFSKLFEQDSFYNPVFRNIYSNISGVHLPYLGLIYMLGVIIQLIKIIDSFRYLKTSFVFLISINIILLVVSTFLFSARMALMASSIVLVYIFFNLLKTQRQKVTSVFVMFLVFILFSQASPIKRRLLEISSTKLEMPDKSYTGNHKAVNFRYVIYSSSFKIIKENLFFGLGLGKVQKELNKYYEKIDYKGYDDFTTKKYNTHNQYLEYFIAYGLMGLIYFILYVFLGFKFNNDLLYRSFVILIGLAFLTENFLTRQAGVLFFVSFNTIFYYHFFHEKSTNTRLVLH